MIRIITDTSSLYTVQDGKNLNIDVVPLCVTIAGKTYREFEEINTDQFNQLIQEGHIPLSSQPPIGDYLELFEKYKDDQILLITIADGLSGTYQSCLAAKQMSDHPQLVVINSKTLCIPQRIVVEAAVDMRDAGASFEEIIAMVEQKCETSTSFLLPQDFDFLKRGGRLTPLAATLSGLLKIQPVVMQSEDGTRLEKFGVGRNFKSAVKKVLAHLKEHGIKETYHFCVSHASAPQQAQFVVDSIKEQFEIAKVELGELSCAFITQGGPHCVAIQVISK